MQKKAGGGKEGAAAALIWQWPLYTALKGLPSILCTTEDSTTHQPPGRSGAGDNTESITSKQTFKMFPAIQNLAAKPQLKETKNNTYPKSQEKYNLKNLFTIKVSFPITHQFFWMFFHSSGG